MKRKETKKKEAVPPSGKKPFPFAYKVIGAGLVIASAVFFVVNNFLKKETPEEEYMFKKEGELLFLDSLNNKKIKIDIEIADNDYDRQLGLMFRKHMEENQGMLFIFPAEEMQSFWMRNTDISLDMIFVNAGQKIVTIQRDT